MPMSDNHQMVWRLRQAGVLDVAARAGQWSSTWYRCLMIDQKIENHIRYS